MRKPIWLGLGAILVVAGTMGLSGQAQAASTAPVVRAVTPASANGCGSMGAHAAGHPARVEVAVATKPRQHLAVPGARHI